MGALLSLVLLLISAAAFASVDLHMHLTMEIPFGRVYSGHLLGKATVKDEKSRFKSRIDSKSLEQSGLKVIVAALIVNPLWGDPLRQIEQQISLLREFCRLHPQWKIVSEPQEVLDEVSRGNKVFILSLEGAWPFQSVHAFQDVLSRHPIRIVTPFHFSDLGGVVGQPAHQRGLVGWMQWLVELFWKKRTKPLNPLGERIVRLMFERRIWIDLTHASRPIIDEFLDIRPKGYPLLVTHTVLGKYYRTDRGIDDILLERLKVEAGAVGLLPSSEMLIGTPRGKDDCSNSAAFLVQWREVLGKIGSQKLFLGSDLNSPLPGLPSTEVTTSCPKPFLASGLVTAADLREIVALQDKNAVRNFVETWRRVRP